MHIRFALALATLAFSTAGFGQVNLDVFQIHRATNLNVGNSYIDLTNTGANIPVGMAIGDPQNICANLYTFDPASELISCCSCIVTPNGLQSLSVLNSLISNPLTPAIPTSVVVKVVASSDSVCNPSSVSILAHGLLAWGTTLHQNTSSAAAKYDLVETPLLKADLSPEELAHLTTTCGFIQANGSGFGICKGCSAGGLGASASIQ